MSSNDFPSVRIRFASSTRSGPVTVGRQPNRSRALTAASPARVEAPMGGTVMGKKKPPCAYCGRWWHWSADHYRSAVPATAPGLLPPDWSQLVPDLVSGVVTGLVAGVVLFLVQRFDSQRADRRNADFLWQGARSSIFMTAAQRSTVNTNDLTEMPEWAGALEVAAAGQPLSLWQSQLGYPSIAVLRETLERIQLLRAAAGYAEGDLSVAVHRASIPGVLRSLIGEVARQMMRGNTDEQLANSFGLLGENLHDMKAGAQKVIDSLPINHVEGYAAAVQRVNRGQEALLEQLRKEDARLNPRELQNLLDSLNS